MNKRINKALKISTASAFVLALLLNIVSTLVHYDNNLILDKVLADETTVDDEKNVNLYCEVFDIETNRNYPGIEGVCLPGTSDCSPYDCVRMYEELPE